MEFQHQGKAVACIKARSFWCKESSQVKSGTLNIYRGVRLMRKRGCLVKSTFWQGSINIPRNTVKPIANIAILTSVLK